MTPSNPQLTAIKAALLLACLLPAGLLWQGFEADSLGAPPTRVSATVLMAAAI